MQITWYSFREKVLPVLKIVLAMIWLANLAHTEAYFSIYILIAFFSFYVSVKKPETGTPGRGGKQLVWILSGLFSLAVLLANYPLFTLVRDSARIGSSTNRMLNAVNTVFSLFGGYYVAEPILRGFFGRFPQSCHSWKKEKGERFLPAFFFLSIGAIHLLHLFLVEYPGNVTEDSFTQISEMAAGQYSNFNTFWHTMLFQGILRLGYGLFGDINAAVALFCVFQILVLAFAFTYCLMTLYRYGVPKGFLAAVYLIYAILPYNLALSITIWKDVLFGAGILLAISAAFRILEEISPKSWKAYGVFVLGSLLMILSRTNGWILALVFALSYGLFLRKNKAFLAASVTVALAGWVLLNPVLSILHIPGSDKVESLSVPIQQVSRVVSEGCALTQEEEALLSQVVDLETVPQRYVNWLSDPMKVAVRDINPGYLEAHIGDYARLWLRLGLRYPAQYLKAWVDQTKGYWNAGYPYAMYSETVTENPYGVAKASNANPIASLYGIYAGLSRHIILFEPLHSIGLQVWLLVLCFCLNLTRKRQAAILCAPLLSIVVGLWFGSPVYCCFRYVYPLFISMPLIFATAVYRGKEKE